MTRHAPDLAVVDALAAAAYARQDVRFTYRDRASGRAGVVAGECGRGSGVPYRVGSAPELVAETEALASRAARAT
ncbi:hypothetical protein [Actinophytocola sp. NPDC049390]|uniref:hypothetical protein n=1 Tax=Actinophytocola sp. NPDC049390 TaxID=3363894 RepID=UPI0037B7C0E0